MTEPAEVFIVIIAILGLLVGSVISFQSGYHVALVDFNIIK